MRMIAFLAACLIACWATLPALAASLAGRDYVVTDGRPDAAPAPLVIVLHGAGGNGRLQQRLTGFDRWAAAYGAVVVYPSAPRRLWNDGRFEAVGNDRIARRDDIAWFRALVAELAASGVADPARVYVIGHSNGGGMAMALACRAPDLVQGIAVVATKVLKDAPCPAAATPVPAVFFYGTADTLAPHAGRPTGTEGALPWNAGRTFSAGQSIAIWARRNGCTMGRPVRIDPAPDGVSVSRFDGTGCRAPLRYFEIAGAGHGWPGAGVSAVRPARRKTEPVVRDIDAGREAMRFWFGR